MCHLHNCIVIDNGRNGGNNDTVSGRKEKQWNKSHHRGWTNVGGRWTTCWNSCVWVRSGYMVVLFVVTDGCCVVTHLFPSDCFATVAVANKTWSWLETRPSFTNDALQVDGYFSQTVRCCTRRDHTGGWCTHCWTGGGYNRSNCGRMGECDDGGCLVVDFGDFEHQLLQTRISVVTLPTPSMVRCGGNSNAHWVVLFVEAYGGGEELRKVKSRVFGSTGSLPSKNVGIWSSLLKVSNINHWS